jgi:hypothetical protein
VCPPTETDVQINLPPGFAPLPCTEAEAKEIRRAFKMTLRQMTKETNRLRVLMGTERSEAAREARRTQGDATAVLVLSKLEEAPAGKHEAAVQEAMVAAQVSRRTVFRAKRRPEYRE